MPTYEYKCSVCENIQDEFHSMSLKPDISCKVCGKPCQKIFSSNGNFILKGTDWPSQNSKMKDEMLRKNSKMKSKMIERESSGEGISKI